MRPLKTLTFESFVESIRRVALRLPDPRQATKVLWEMPAVVLSSFAMFFFQQPSMLSYQTKMKKKHGVSNLERVFGIENLPSDSQIRNVMDGAPVEPLRRLLPETFEKMRRIGWTQRYITELDEQKLYTIAVDGSEYYHSTTINCPGCLRKEYKEGQVHYSHITVSATLVKAGSHAILPLDVEEVRNEDGTEKQDCEINAGKRMVERLRQEHRQMNMCITADDIYAHEPFVELLRENRMGFVLVSKPLSHKEMFSWIEGLETLPELERGEHIIEGQWEEGTASKRKYFKYRIVPQVPLTQSHKVKVNYVELWEHNKDGKEIYHNSWTTDYKVTPDNVKTICAIGRSRWKIENEHFNVHKNQGYELEHNYGHGNQTLSMVFYILNLLAFVAHKLLEIGDGLYQQCMDGLSRRDLWELLRSAFYYFPVDSWQALLRFHLEEPAKST